MLNIANNCIPLNKAACKSYHVFFFYYRNIVFTLAFRGTDLLCAIRKLEGRHFSKAVWHVKQHYQ